MGWSTLTGQPPPNTFSASRNTAYDPASGNIYSLGGSFDDGSASTDTYIYSVSGDSWSIAATAYANGSANAWVMSGLVYSFDTGTNAMAIYDPSTDSWTSGASRTFPTGFGMLLGVTQPLYNSGTKIFYGDNLVNSSFDHTQVSVSSYDAALDVWTNECMLANTYVTYGAALYTLIFFDGTLYHFCDQTIHTTSYLDGSDTGASPPVYPGSSQVALYGAFGMITSSVFFIAGGAHINTAGTDYDLIDETYTFDSSSNTWTTQDPCPVIIAASMAAPVTSGVIYVFNTVTSLTGSPSYGPVAHTFKFTASGGGPGKNLECTTAIPWEMSYGVHLECEAVIPFDGTADIDKFYSGRATIPPPILVGDQHPSDYLRPGFDGL